MYQFMNYIPAKTLKLETSIISHPSELSGLI